MDGYAVRSSETASASEQTPVLLKVQGTIAAGDSPEAIFAELELGSKRRTIGPNLCVEIMTGAIFPDSFDACVKVEDTTLVEGLTGKHILVKKPVGHNANRRFAGSDMLEGDVILKRGEMVRSSHILPLASIGLESVPVLQKPRVGIWSTGAEMLNGNGATRDANGPYLMAAAREMRLQVDFLGVLQDDPATIQHHLQNSAESGAYDVLITSGAVSKGRFDHIRGVLDKMGAEIVFHGLAIRPGHPVLFAMLPGAQRRTAFFGLPGNPGAAAACFRSLTVPYLLELQGQPVERPLLARLVRQPAASTTKHTCHPTQPMDCFRHGVLSTSVTGHLVVEPSADQSPAKLGPFIAANCWIHFRPDHGGTLPGPGGGQMVECYPLSPTGAISLSQTLLN